ncbi:MAG: hypothetical protein LLG13_01600 [Bacteroidales bacterium]|nr:hypothetical protein [Bacteroidales bacterium]
MKNHFLVVITGLIIFLLSGCTPVKFYSNSGLSENSGLKYYTEKPYLLVERNSEDRRIIKATFVYLPDLANPHYMVINGGLGSGRVEIKLKDGSISSLGMSSDSKIARTTEALAELVSEGKDAITELKALAKMPAVSSSAINMELYEIIIGGSGTVMKKIEIN